MVFLSTNFCVPIIHPLRYSLSWTELQNCNIRPRHPWQICEPSESKTVWSKRLCTVGACRVISSPPHCTKTNLGGERSNIISDAIVTTTTVKELFYGWQSSTVVSTCLKEQMCTKYRPWWWCSRVCCWWDQHQQVYILLSSNKLLLLFFFVRPLLILSLIRPFRQSGELFLCFVLCVISLRRHKGHT